jgi:hypothetical protein
MWDIVVINSTKNWVRTGKNRGKQKVNDQNRKKAH